MSEAIIVSDTGRAPGRALMMRAVRASGRGGHVNKVATKIDLGVDRSGMDLDAIEGLSEAPRPRSPPRVSAASTSSDVGATLEQSRGRPGTRTEGQRPWMFRATI